MSSPKPASPRRGSPKAESPPKSPLSPRYTGESPRHLDFPQHAGLIGHAGSPKGEELEGRQSIGSQIADPGGGSLYPGTPSASQIQPDHDSGVSDADTFDSVYSDSDVGSITDTLSSSIKDYTYENGRRYHAYKCGEWIVPNDDTQQEQMDIFHVIHSRAIGDKLFLAPIGTHPQRVLDLGCGTGIWVMDFADQFPSAAVVGNDLSPIQPSWVPPNAAFEVDDFNMEWTYTPESFDYIHVRALHGAVADWHHLLTQAYKVLKPGGWIEVSDDEPGLYADDGSMPPDSVLLEWTRLIVEGLDMMGKPVITGAPMPGWIEEAGFDRRTLRQEVFKVPVGTWARSKELKELGALNLLNMLTGCEGWTIAIYTRILGKSEEWTRQHLEQVKKELRMKKQHTYWKLYVAYAQKPY